MNTFPPLASVPALAPPHTSLSSLLRGLIPSAVCLAALVFFSGCTTTSPTDRAARFLASTVQSVDSAMQGYATCVALGVVSEHDQKEVRKLYADYQAAEALAETAIITAIKTGDAGSLAAATAALDASKFKLLAFLARFTTSPPATNWKTNLQSTSEVKPLPWAIATNAVLYTP